MMKLFKKTKLWIFNMRRYINCTICSSEMDTKQYGEHLRGKRHIKNCRKKDMNHIVIDFNNQSDDNIQKLTSDSDNFVRLISNNVNDYVIENFNRDSEQEPAQEQELNGSDVLKNQKIFSGLLQELNGSDVLKNQKNFSGLLQELNA